MLKSRLLPLFALLLLIVPSRTLTAQLQVGGGVGFLFDEQNDYLVLSGQLRLPLGKSNWVLSPRAQSFVGLHVTQFEADLLYQIPTAANGALQPYMGLGGGATHTSDLDFSETKATLNLIAGTRIAPKGSVLSVFLESHYSASSNSADREVIYGGILLRLGGR